MTPPSHSPLLEALVAAVGPAHCLRDPELVSSYSVDWTRRFAGPAVCVVRPGTSHEVADVLVAAREHGAAVIAQGGNTGLVGGSVPRRSGEERPQVVLSTTRLGGLVVGQDRRRLTAGAGVTLTTAAGAARREGLRLGIDLAARDSATLGGMVATNAGGLQAFRFGRMSERVCGVEAVLADGSVVGDLGRGRRDALGWRPSALLGGSEGTLGVVTSVELSLLPEPPERAVVLVATPTPTDAMGLVTDVLFELPELEAIELTLEEGMRLVVDRAHLAVPPGLDEEAQAWLTLEVAGRGDPLGSLASFVEDPRVIAASVGTTSTERTLLWAYRERHSDIVSLLGVPHKLDVAVAPNLVAPFLEEVRARVAAVDPEAKLFVWGHVGDGNLHVNVIGPPPEDEAADDAVLELVLAYGGAVAAEHGVGVQKGRWLRRALGDETVALMTAVRRALDPARILNPGVLEPPD